MKVKIITNNLELKCHCVNLTLMFINIIIMDMYTGKGEKKGSKDKDRNSILSRPFQKLPPPFEFNEHHTMHSHTTLPIAIYEKEPTSIIAYALASREYTLKLVQLKDKSVSKIQVLVGGGGGVGGVVETKASQSATPKVQ